MFSTWHPDDVERIVPFSPTGNQNPQSTWNVEDVDKIAPFSPIKPNTWTVEDVDKIISFMPCDVDRSTGADVQLDTETTNKTFHTFCSPVDYSGATLNCSADAAISSQHAGNCSLSPSSQYVTPSESVSHSPAFQCVTKNSSSTSSCASSPYKTEDEAIDTAPCDRVNVCLNVNSSSADSSSYTDTLNCYDSDEDEFLPAYQEEVKMHSDRANGDYLYNFSHISIPAPKSFGRGESLMNDKHEELQDVCHKRGVSHDAIPTRGRGAILKEYFNRHKTDEMLQLQLRRAVGAGYSNELIEHYWRDEMQDEQNTSESEVSASADANTLAPSVEALSVSETITTTTTTTTTNKFATSTTETLVTVVSPSKSSTSSKKVVCPSTNDVQPKIVVRPLTTGVSPKKHNPLMADASPTKVVCPLTNDVSLKKVVCPLMTDVPPEIAVHPSLADASPKKVIDGPPMPTTSLTDSVDGNSATSDSCAKSPPKKKKSRRNRNALMLSLANMKEMQKDCTEKMPPGGHTYVGLGLPVTYAKNNFHLDRKDFPPLS